MKPTPEPPPPETVAETPQDPVRLAADKRAYRKTLALDRARSGQRGSHSAVLHQAQRDQEAAEKVTAEETPDDAVATGTSEDERNDQDKQSEEHRAK
jgi:hypothetical protein